MIPSERFRRLARIPGPRTTCAFLLFPLLLLLTPATHSFSPEGGLAAQEPFSWTFPATIGYAGAGGAVGYLVGQITAQEANDSGRPRDTGVAGGAGGILGLLLGGWLGYKMGLEADSLLAENVELRPGHRHGLQLGTVLAGAAAGTGFGFLVSLPRDGERTPLILAFAASGAVLGGVAQLQLNHRLHPSDGDVAIRLGTGGGGGFSLGVSLTFSGVGPGRGLRLLSPGSAPGPGRCP